MPAPAPINPDLVRALFDYDPETGQLIPKPTAKRAAYRKSSTQWEIGAHNHSTHRLIWAWHNPQMPNPYGVKFRDNDTKNTRIENLYAIQTNPRWADHVKQVKMKITADGQVVPVGKMPVLKEAVSPSVEPVRPRMSVLRKQQEQGQHQHQHHPVPYTESFEESVTREATTQTLNHIVDHWDE